MTKDFQDFQFNTMVAGLIEFTNELMKQKDPPVANTPAWREAMEALVLMMAPSTPYVVEELWERLGNAYSVHQQSWPLFDPVLAKDDVVEIAVQVNGKVRDKIMIPADANQEAAMTAALASARVTDHVAGREPSRIIYVPGRLMNVIVK